MDINHLLNLAVYLVIGTLFTNGLPHFAAGSAGLPFRLFSAVAAAPKVNVIWGMVNFIAATILLTWRLSVETVGRGEVIALVVGLWAGILMFGAAASWFYKALGPKAGWIAQTDQPNVSTTPDQPASSKDSR